MTSSTYQLAPRILDSTEIDERGDGKQRERMTLNKYDVSSSYILLLAARAGGRLGLVM